MNIGGVYQLVSVTDPNKFYIGSTSNFDGRRSDHLSALIKNRHINPHLQSSWNLYGQDSLVFEALIVCDSEEALTIEQKILDMLHPCYNIALDVKASRKGRHFTHSEEAKRKIGLASRGRTPMLGHRHSLEARRKIGLASKGNTYRLGCKLSEEHKRKIGQAHKGMKRSDETRRKMRENSARAMLGRKHSEETKRKMSEAGKRYWAEAKKNGTDARLKGVH